MKRRQVISMWSAVVGVCAVKERPSIGKESTRSEVSEYAGSRDARPATQPGPRIAPKQRRGLPVN